MKFVHASLAALVASSLLGCEPVSPDQEIDTYVRQEAAKLATQQQELDKTELQQTIATLKQRDPLVKDVYYTVDEQGNRELNIVRESEQQATGGSSGAETFTYALLGMGAAMWMMNSMNSASMMNNGGGYSSSYYSQKATKRFAGTKEENERRRSSGTAAYVASTNAKISNNVYSRARSGAYSSASGSTSSSRPAFGSSGARTGSVGG